LCCFGFGPHYFNIGRVFAVNISRDELQTLCDELDRVYNIMREDYDNSNYDLLRVKMLGFWRELKFYLDSLDTL